jgi:hypothetical protein
MQTVATGAAHQEVNVCEKAMMHKERNVPTAA